MIATLINVAMVLVGSAIGLLFKHLIRPALRSILTQALGLCVLGIGISSLIKTDDMLCVIVCMVAGTVLGHAIDLERRLEQGGDWLRARVEKGKENSRFSEGFINAFLLFCVGAMAITGSIEAGLNHNYTVLLSKSVIDGVTAISFAAAMGVGVAFAVIPLFLYQGLITLLAAWAGPLLPAAVITEMTAVGGVLITAIAINLLDLGKRPIKVANMIPAMFLPIAYVPLAQWLTGLF